MDSLYNNEERGRRSYCFSIFRYGIKKVRPVVILPEPSGSGSKDDIVVSLISPNIPRQLTKGDHLLKAEDPDFLKTGLKVPSVSGCQKFTISAKGYLRGR